MTLDPRDRKIIIGAGVTLLLLLGLALLLAPEQPAETEVPSTYSPSSGGAKAAYLLLEQLGYNVTRWTDVPQALPEDATGTTLVLAVPTDQPTESERDALADFVRNGGRVLAVGRSALSMFKDIPFEPGAPILARQQFRAVLPGHMARIAPEITMVPFIPLRPSPGQIALYGNDHGAVVVRCPYGTGEIVWWAGATPLTNSGLRDRGSIELLLSAIGNRSTRVLWDEHFHGLQQGMGHLLARTPLPWALLQCAAVLLAAMLTFSRRSGPIHEPAEPSRLSPLEYADTLGGLFRRARATDVAVQVALDRFRMLASRKLGRRADAKPEELYSALQSRFHFNDPEFVSVLQQCESARVNSRLDQGSALRLTQALQHYGVQLKFSTAPGDNA